MNFNLKNRKWDEYLFVDIFDIKKGYYNKKPKSSNQGNIPFLSATQYNNGISEFYNISEIENASKTGDNKNDHSLSEKIFKGNCIAVTNNGSVGYAFYQKSSFTCSHDINPLYLKNHILNPVLAKFLIATIEKQRVCFEYARKWRPKRMVKSKILLPSNSKGEPDYEFMEQYIQHKKQEKQKEYQEFIKSRLKELKNTPKTVELNEKEWGEFFIEEIAEIISGQDIYSRERIEGNTPYVSATANQNGIGYFVGNENKTLESNCLSVNRNGSVGYSFYHPYKALFGNDCRKLRLNNPEKHIGLFISNQITRQRGKYGYGYKMGTARLKRQKIMLPINESSTPDYEFIENYMKNLEYKKLSEYLEFKHK